MKSTKFKAPLARALCAIKRTVSAMPRMAVTSILLAILCLTWAAKAEEPEKITVDRTFLQNTFFCDFPVDEHLQGYWLVWPNKDVAANWQITFTNPATGKCVLVRLSGLEKFRFEVRDDGMLLMYDTNTLAYRLILPGVATEIDVGRASLLFVIDPATGEMVDFRVLSDSNARSDDVFGMMCQLLAP